MSKKTRRQAQNTEQTAILTDTEIATPGAAEYTSLLEYLPNPDKILIELGGNIKVYREMVDAHMDSVRSKRYAAVTARPWQLSSDEGDQAKVKWVQEYLWKLSPAGSSQTVSGANKVSSGFRGTISQMLRAIDFGYAVHEIVWGWSPSPWGDIIMPMAIKERKQEWFLFDADGNLLFQKKDGTREAMPPRKFVVTRRAPSDINPYGENVMSRCFWPLMFKRGGLKFRMLLAEKYGIPKAVGKLPGGATETEKSSLLKMLRSLVRDAVAVIPANGSVDVLEPKGTGTSGDNIHQSIIQDSNQEVSKAWLGETLTTEQTNAGGTQAMATVHNDVRTDLALDDAQMIEESVNTLLRWIWGINWPDDPLIPWFDIVMPEDLKTARLERDSKLSALGVRFRKAYFSNTYEIPDDQFDVVDPSQQSAPGGSFAEGDRHDHHGCGCFAEGELKSNVRQMLADLSPKELQDQIAELAKPIIDLAESSGTYPEFEAALNKAVPNLSSKALEQSVTKCLLLSEMQGRADA